MMQKINQVSIYKDFTSNLDVKKHSKELMILENEKAVSNAIKNLIMSSRGEYLYQPNKGCGIKKYLFEPLDATTINSLKNEIEQTINDYEPRVDSLYVEIKDNEENQQIIVNIYYTITSTDTPILLTIPIKTVR